MSATLRAGFTVAALFGATVAWGGPLDRTHVANDARWVVHLDLDNFRSSQVGDCLIKARIETEMAKARADLKTYLDFDFDWTQINSLSAYGTDFQRRGKAEGVLLIQTSLDVQQGLESAIAKQAQAGVDGNVKRVQEGPVPIYSLRNEIFVALPAGKPVVVARTQAMLDKGLDVLLGQAPNLAASSTFLDFPPVPKGFAFLAMAAGFADAAPLPPQARILKMTDAGQVAIGETGNQVFMAATLRAKSAEVGAQMQQVIQGLIALGALGQAENQELLQLLQSTKVTVVDRMVTLGLEIPAATVVQKIQHRQSKGGTP